MAAFDIAGTLGALFNNMQATGGGVTKTFPYVAWGRHLDTPGDFVTVRLVAGEPIIADTGPRPEYRYAGLYDVHFYWTDDVSLTDPDALRKAVTEAVAAVVGTNATPGGVYFLRLGRGVDLSGFLPKTRVLAYQYVQQLHTFSLEAV